MHGRLRRKARVIALTTYGSAEDANAAVERVRRIHGGIAGTLPNGSPYSADDPGLLAWVHVTERLSFCAAWMRYVEPGMPTTRQDAYVSDVAKIGRALDADPVPTTRHEAETLIAAMRPTVRAMRLPMKSLG